MPGDIANLFSSFNILVTHWHQPMHRECFHKNNDCSYRGRDLFLSSYFTYRTCIVQFHTCKIVITEEKLHHRTIAWIFCNKSVTFSVEHSSVLLVSHIWNRIIFVHSAYTSQIHLSRNKCQYVLIFKLEHFFILEDYFKKISSF